MNFQKILIGLVGLGAVGTAVTFPVMNHIDSINSKHKHDMDKKDLEHAKEKISFLKDNNKYLTAGTINNHEMWKSAEKYKVLNQEYKDNDPTILRKGCRIVKDDAPKLGYEYMSECSGSILVDANGKKHEVAFLGIIPKKGTELETYLKNAHEKIKGDAYDSEKHGILER